MIKGVPFGIQETPCPYLEGRTFYSETLYVPEVDSEGLDSLLSVGFRHFGATFFRPVCDSCGRCIPLRIRVDDFRFSRNRRRALRRGEGLETLLVDPKADAEKHELYLKHGERFDLGGSEGYEDFRDSFFSHVPFAKVLEIRRDGKLLAASHVDITDRSLSAMYCYWDPQESALGLGTYALLKEVEIAASKEIPHLYLGYYIEENRHMNYKARFYPNEALIREGHWLPFYDSRGELVGQEVSSHGFLPILRMDRG